MNNLSKTILSKILAQTFLKWLKKTFNAKLRSFKWQPGATNIHTPFSAGESFTVLSRNVKLPEKIISIDGKWKAIYGQRKYMVEK